VPGVVGTDPATPNDSATIPVPAGLPRTERISVMAASVRSRFVFTLMDAAVVVAGYGLAQVATLRDRAPSDYWEGFLLFVAVAVVAHLSFNGLFGLYGRIWRHAGVEEARAIVVACGAALAVLLAAYGVARALHVPHVPLRVLPIGCLMTMMGVGVIRFHSRLLGWQRGNRSTGLRVAVIGSNDAGASVLREMLRDPSAGLLPVAVFDDDRRTHGLSLMGVPVVGSIDDIPAVAPRLGIQQMLLAVQDPPSGLVERCLNAAESAEIVLKVIPGVRDIVGSATPPGAFSVRSAREPRIEDLLGRSEVVTDLAAVRSSLMGRRVLVTGAGGSIGAEICRQVATFDPELLLMLDHDETHLHEVSSTASCRFEQLLVDVSHGPALESAFSRWQPDVVFHAAAHKHVPILETHVVEAVSTNVLGTLNVMKAAAQCGVGRFVLISTDKAVRPISVMGATKRLGEQLLIDRAPTGSAYCTVRFGNVLGSRGSVIPTFRRQIAAGGPVTVTDPHMMRWFMSVEEAVQLVLQASVMADRGDVFMLEMGEPVRILDLAQRMIRLSGYHPGTDIPIKIVGRRPGERLHEELYDAREQLVTTSHPSILRLVAPGHLSPARLESGLDDLCLAVSCRDEDSARRILFELIKESEAPAPEREAPRRPATTAQEGIPA
jgi:FlaA1/EpsC-like NDP-sugar epimerase